MVIYPLLIGYHSLEAWLQSVDRQRPVFVSLSTRVGESEGYNVRSHYLEIVAAQPETGGEIVHYCLLQVGRLRFVNGEPFDANHSKIRQMSDDVHDLVKNWMIEQGLQVSPGLVAFPTNIRLLSGRAEFLNSLTPGV